MTQPPKLRKTKRVKVVKRYPNFPRMPRAQRIAFDPNESKATNIPVRFRRRTFSMETQTATGVTSPYGGNVDSEVSVGFSAIKTFQKNTDWKQRVAKGQNATYPYSRTGGSVKPITWQGITTGNGIRAVTVGSYYGVVLVDEKDNTALKDVALTRLKRKLNGYIGNAQLAAPLAESREIHRLVRQINGFGLDAVKKLLLIKRTKGKSAFKLFGDIWLGFGFGINPMLKDIEAAANAILDYTTRDDRHVRVSGTASRDYQSMGETTGWNISTGALLDTKSVAHHWQGVRIVAGIDLQIRSSGSYSVTDHLGLEISDIPSALWELVPFSWCVDYFSTVSWWLDDMFYTVPGTVKYVSQSTKYMNEVYCFPKVYPSNVSLYRHVGAQTVGKSNYFSFARTSLTTLPTRSLRVKSTDEIAKYGLTKLINLASVLAGRLKTPHV